MHGYQLTHIKTWMEEVLQVFQRLLPTKIDIWIGSMYTLDILNPKLKLMLSLSGQMMTIV